MSRATAVTKVVCPFLIYFVLLAPPLTRLQDKASSLPGLSTRPSSLILPFQFLFVWACFPRLLSERGVLRGCLGCHFCLGILCSPSLFFSFSISFFLPSLIYTCFVLFARVRVNLWFEGRLGTSTASGVRVPVESVWL